MLGLRFVLLSLQCRPFPLEIVHDPSVSLRSSKTGKIQLSPSSMKVPSRHDRRAPDRPVVGDSKPCPACADGMLEFTDRYRMSSAKGATEARPAWVCDICPNVVFVRVRHQPAAVRTRAREIRAIANRRLMKARFVRGKSNRALRKSADRKKKR